MSMDYAENKSKSMIYKLEKQTDGVLINKNCTVKLFI